MIQRSPQVINFPSSTGTKPPTLATRRPAHDTSRFCVSTTAPSPELLTHVGHALLRSIATGQGDQLRHAADALVKLTRLLPGAGAEGRMIAVLLAVTDDATSQPVVASPAPQPSPARPTRIARSNKSARQPRKIRTASVPRMDASGRLQPSKEIGGVAVISQAEARKALGMSCIQMIKLENQKLLGRIQESGSRLVFYDVCQVQHLLDMIDATPPPPL